MQNCRESPSVLKFLPAENRTGLLRSQRSRQRTEDAAGSEADMAKGMARSREQHPQEPALSCGTVTEKTSLCVLYRVISTTQHTAPSAL